MKRYIRTFKTLYPNFENVISELWKRYIRTLKTLYPNFENFTSELWKRYIRTLKTLYPNFENVISELWKRYIRTMKRYIRTKRSRLKSWTNEQKWTIQSELKKNSHCDSRASFFFIGKGAD